MCREGEYEQLFAELEKCLFRAEALGLTFAAELVKMTFIEISNRYNSECNQPITIPSQTSSKTHPCSKTMHRLTS
jgi:hypothetical protein